MLQDKAASEENHKRFVERVLSSRAVWYLRGPNGAAFCPSNEYEATDVILFWSDRAYAARQLKEEWQNYEVASLSLDDFIDHWLRGMNQDGVLAGTNWDAHLFGLEIDPIELAQELVEAKSRG